MKSSSKIVYVTKKPIYKLLSNFTTFSSTVNLWANNQSVIYSLSCFNVIFKMQIFAMVFELCRRTVGIATMSINLVITLCTKLLTVQFIEIKGNHAEALL